MTYRFVQRNTVVNRDFFTFSGLAPFSSIEPMVGTGLVTSFLIEQQALGFLRPVPVVAVVEVLAQLLVLAVSAPPL
jgi:hypothetical protein